MSANSNRVQAEKLQPRGSSHYSFNKLPRFYVQAIFRPTPDFFKHAAEYANWGSVWFQLLLLLTIPALLGLIRSVAKDNSTGINTHSNIIFGLLDVITVGATIGAFIFKLIFLPLIFFLAVGIQYMLARVFKGQGNFVNHAFAMLLYQVPLSLSGGIIITVLVLFHILTLFFAPIISLALFCYGIFINIHAVMGVHTINREKALATVALPYILGFLTICGTLIALTNYLANAISSLH